MQSTWVKLDVTTTLNERIIMLHGWSGKGKGKMKSGTHRCRKVNKYTYVTCHEARTLIPIGSNTHSSKNVVHGNVTHGTGNFKPIEKFAEHVNKLQIKG